MKQFIYMRNGDDNTDMVLTFPYDGIRSIHMTGDGDMKIQLEGDDNAAGSARLDVTSNKEKEVMKAIVNAQRSSRNPLIVLADDVDKQYLMSDITACNTLNHDG